LAGLHNASRVTFVAHIHPDPDAIGSMMGLAHLVETCLGKPTRLTRDGLINRAENRALVELLHVELWPVEKLNWCDDEAVVMVDSQPKTGRHNLNGGMPIYGVIDHHATPGALNGIKFIDVRPNLGATCSLVTRYLIEQEIPLPDDLATALLYGIETELSGYPREASSLDDSAVQYLHPLADKDLLARIRNARLPQGYFECILQALQSSFIYDRLIISWVNDMPQPELAAEVCDFMIRYEAVDWAVCAGVCGDKLVISARSSLREAEAGELLRAAVGRMGKAGGHSRRAGGCIKLAGKSVDDVQSELRRRLLKYLKIDECRGQRLVKLSEILENLQS
jgi:nanoRNase/pAp phosphatase (c-di-AMP/oligoRNAs hydrolase)